MPTFARIVVLVLLATTLLPSPTALAGGNWLGFKEEPGSGAPPNGPGGGDRNLGTWAVLHVGQRVVAHTGIYVTNPDRLEMLESKGPYYAWLSRGDGYVDDANVPADAIKLGTFDVRFDGSNGVPVRAHFTVPAVPSGKYQVLVCNEPCTLSGFGEYIQGWITIVQTPDEARWFTLARDRKWEAREAAQRINRLSGDLAGLRAELVAAGSELREQTLRARGAESRRAAFDARTPAEPRSLAPWWSLALLAAAVVASALLIRRRRLPAFDVPDTVPDDLVERDRAGV